MWAIGKVILLVGLFLTFSFALSGADYVINMGPPSGVDDTAVLQGALDGCVQQH